jgi:signal transduction histidine kinase
MTACLLSGKGWSGEYPAFHRDGTLLHVQATITPITNEAGDMIFAIGVSTDITERKQAELALQQSNQSLSQRLDELSTLNLIAQAVSTVVDLPDALDVVVATTTRLLDAAGTGIVLLSDDRSELTLISLFDRRSPAFSGGREGDSEAGSTDAAYRGMVFPVEDSVLTQKLLEEGQAVIVSDAQHDPRLAQAHRILQAGQVCGLMLVPLLSQGNTIGIMGITSDRPGREFTPDEVRLAETIAGQITGAIEATRLLEQVQKRAVAGERSRLARDLHDSVTQSLYSLDLFANAIHQALSAGRTERVTDHAEKIRSLSQSALADLRLLIFELRPPLLDQAGLAGALRARLESVEARAGFKTEIEVQAERSLPAIVEAELYAVALEALNNVLKHARADQVTVKLAYDEQRCCLTIRDDGLGFDPEIANNGGGFGLQTMRERVERIGGTMTLDTSPGRGTTVSVEVNA